jgi:hypothetical protein
MVEPHPGGLIVCQTLFEDDFLISGDFKGKVKLWSKSTDRLDQGELTVDDDGEFSIVEPLKNLPTRYFYEGKYNSLTMTAKRHQQSVTVTVLEVLHAKEGSFVSGNSYGELRGWKLMRGETVLFGEDVKPKLLLNWKIAAAHIGTVDIALRVGGLLVTTGKGGIIKVWEAGRQGDQRPEMLQTYSLNRQTSTSLGSGSFGVVEEAWSEDRVVGLDMVGGSMVGLRQDGFFGVWR